MGINSYILAGKSKPDKMQGFIQLEGGDYGDKDSIIIK